MADHVCSPFRMRCDSFSVEADGRCWVLHVFDVEGEEEDIGVFLSLGSGEYASFLDDFQSSVMAQGPSHGLAALCPGCRPRDRSEWLPRFSDWVKAAYSSMPFPPTTHDEEDVPQVVRLSLECICGGTAPDGGPSLN
jgi:hypothetical protein